MMGGETNVESESGVGTAFTVRLAAEVDKHKAQSMLRSETLTEQKPECVSTALVTDNDPNVN
jgi:hypothetical protein